MIGPLPRLPAAVLPDFLARLRQLFPNLVHGVYIIGSVALGDYHDRKSDIDFLVLLHQPLTAAQLAQCATLHQGLEQHRANLSGYYLTLAELASPAACFPSFFEGRLLLRRPFELDKVSLFEWHTTALTLAGPPATEVAPAPPIAAVIDQLHQNLNSYWQHWITSHAFPRPGYWQLLLFPRLTEWGMLGVARQLYTLDTHQIASKQAAGHYYLLKVADEYRATLHEALTTREINRTRLRPSITRARQTLACMAYLLATFNQRYQQQAATP